MSTEVPWPLIEVAVEPKSRADQEKLAIALTTMAADDPAFGFGADQESGHVIIKGSAEWQLQSKAEILRRAYKIDFNAGQPQAAYRESLGRAAEIDYTHRKQAAGSGQYARVKILFEPRDPGAGYEFQSRVVGGSVPAEYILGVEKGLLSAKESGLLAGFPVIDFRATLVDVEHHNLDSSMLAFEIAAYAAFRELRERVNPILLEPIMKVEVTTPEDCAGDVISDLNSRHGMIQDADRRDDSQVIIAMVPLANMFGYANALRSFSDGRARFVMTYEGYRPLPFPSDPDPDVFPPAAAMRA